MNVHIPKSQKSYIDDLIKSGTYKDADAVLKDALNLHEQAYTHKLNALKSDINAAWDGSFTDFDMATFLQNKTS